MTTGGNGSAQHSALPAIRQQREGRVLFARDARIALALLNEARYRNLERYLGISKDQANIATLILLMIAGERAQHYAKRMLAGVKIPLAHSVDDLVVFHGSVRGLLLEATGLDRENPPLFFGPVIALVFVTPPARRLLRKSIHSIRDPLHRAAVSFHGRYGYLVDPGHWREQRARATSEPSEPTGSTERGEDQEFAPRDEDQEFPTRPTRRKRLLPRRVARAR